MRILQIIDRLSIGGAERVFVDMCNVLYENNQNVSAFLLLDAKGELAKELKVPLKVLHRKSKWNLSSMYDCSKVLKKYDIVHCHCRHVYRYVALVHFIFRVQSKLVFQDHYGSIDVDKGIPFLFGSLLKPNYYIGVSATLTKWANHSLKLNEDRIFLLQNIINKRLYQDTAEKNLDFLLVSNIKSVKNNLFAVALSKTLNRSLLLVGKNQDNSYYEKVTEEVTNEIKIDTTISDAQRLMRKAKMGLHTSKSETGPLVLIEYLAQGLPFLAYETGEVAKMLQPHFPDYFINNFNVQEWEQRINKIEALSVDTAKMQMVFEQYFGQQPYYEKLKNIYVCISKN
jgi:glycosyltransferase involved in cell wall biosynthesis